MLNVIAGRAQWGLAELVVTVFIPRTLVHRFNERVFQGESERNFAVTQMLAFFGTTFVHLILIEFKEHFKLVVFLGIRTGMSWARRRDVGVGVGEAARHGHLLPRARRDVDGEAGVVGRGEAQLA
jgi:hypothetical protein